MRLKNQYYCIFVFNNNYITGSSAYEGGYRKTDMKQERRTGFYPVRLSTLGRSAGIRTRGLMDPNHARYQTSPHPVHTMDTIIAVLPPVVKRGNLLRIAKGTSAYTCCEMRTEGKMPRWKRPIKSGKSGGRSGRAGIGRRCPTGEKRAAWRWVRVRSAGWRSWQYVWRCFWWYLSEKEYFQESSRRYGRLF